MCLFTGYHLKQVHTGKISRVIFSRIHRGKITHNFHKFLIFPQDLLIKVPYLLIKTP